MDRSKYLIYYYGPKNQLFDRLQLRFSNTYDVLCKEDIMPFEIMENNDLLAVLSDLNLLDCQFPEKLHEKNKDVPIIGLSDHHLIQHAGHYITDIVTLNQDALTRFDMLDKKLLNYKKARFGVNANSNFRSYIINQHVQEPGFIQSLSSVYQPIYNIQGTNFDSFEVLMRWTNAPFKDFRINELFSAVSEDRILDAITMQQFAQITEFMAELYESTGRYYNTYINLSPAQFQNPLILNELREKVELYNIPPEYIFFEIHPDEFRNNPPIWKENIREINNMNANVSMKFANIDDMSVADLEQYRIKSMKLQKNIIQNGINQTHQQLITDARNLNINLVAEQVETAQHFDIIQQSPINEAQGYFFYQPLEAQKLFNLLKKGG